MVQEAELEQERRYEEIREAEQPSLLDRIGTKNLIFIAVVVLFIYYYYTTGGTKSNFVLLLGIVLAAVILMSFTKEKRTKLSEEECRAISWNWIRNAQQTIHGFPQGDVEMLGVGKEHEFQGNPKYWEFYFTIRNLDGIINKYSIAVYSYGDWQGHIKHIRPRPSGWTGKEAPDVFRHFIPAPKGYISPQAEQFRKMEW